VDSAEKGDAARGTHKNLKISENNSYFSLDKCEKPCYTQLVNKNCSQIGGANGAENQAIPKAKRDPGLP
jgi:hypothetical protein